MSGFERFTWTGFQRRFVAVWLLVSHALIATGLPLPAAEVGSGKDLSTPFPCMNRPCGCRSAEQCWRSCCCTTLQERLAWARENGVEPPAFVVQGETKKDAAPASCKKSSCCRPKARTKSTWINGLMALDCQGHGPMAFFLDAPSLPPDAAQSLRIDWQMVGAMEVVDEEPRAGSLLPDVPPPRRNWLV